MTYQERLIDVLKGIQMALDEWDHYSDDERNEWVRLVRPQVQDALDPTLDR